MININITHINQDDVHELTEIARANDLATDYHINEAPMTQQDHFKHLDGNTTVALAHAVVKCEVRAPTLFQENG